MKTCFFCKSSNPDEAKFCHMCGKKIIWPSLKETIIFGLGLLGIGIISIGLGLMGYSLGIGVLICIVGVWIVMWAYKKDKK